MKTLMALCLAAALLSACAPSSGGRMSSEKPPEGWLEELIESRERKDRYFVESPESPLPPDAKTNFDGLDYWEPDPKFRFVGEIHEYPQRQRFDIITTTGQPRPCERYGWLSFVHDGQAQNLQIYRLLDQRDTGGASGLFLPFTDGTSGEQSYPAGRYVQLAEGEDGRYVLDFNAAINPFCAYGSPELFACPVTPRENRLLIRIEAGERGYDPEAAESAMRHVR